MKILKTILVLCALGSLSGCSNETTKDGEKAAETFEGNIYYCVDYGMKVFDINQQQFEAKGIVNGAIACQYEDGVLHRYSMSSDGNDSSTQSHLVHEEICVEVVGNVMFYENAPRYKIYFDANKILIEYSSSYHSLYYTESYAKSKNIEIMYMK